MATLVLALLGQPAAGQEVEATDNPTAAPPQTGSAPLPAPDPLIVLDESEGDSEPTGEGEEIVEGYYESSYLLQTVDGEEEGHWWEIELPSPSIGDINDDGMVFDDITINDDCSKSSGHGGGSLFQNSWTSPDGVPNY